jgi:formate hydrogenlyase transcriptional activator
MNEVRQMPQILIADDSEESLHLLVSIFDEEGYDARPVMNGTLALKAARLSAPDLILLDIRLPDIDGYEVCAKLKEDERTRDIPVLFISGLHATSDKVRGFSSGGVDYITKPFQVEEIRARVRTHLALRGMSLALRDQNCILEQEIDVRKKAEGALQEARDQLEKRVQQRTRDLEQVNETLRKEMAERKRAQHELQEALKEIQRLSDQLKIENRYLRQAINEYRGSVRHLGDSPVMRDVLTQIEQVARTNTSVLVLGETGTGKELVAEMIHAASQRKDRTMIKVNCAALPSGIMESELFGRAKGAYTGASTDQPGRFEIADGSTIFLDEVGELAHDLQAKLLRVLQDGTFERLGSSRTIRVDVRVIAATNKDLEAMVREGKFRLDLYYRLNVFPIAVPPLRQRTSDLPALTQSFIQEFAEKMRIPVKTVDRSTMDAMMTYQWPGNVRELRNLVERGMIVSLGTALNILLPDASGLVDSDNMMLEEMERRHIVKVLESTQWRVKGRQGAAAILGLKPTTLQSKMQKLGIERPSSV